MSTSRICMVTAYSDEFWLATTIEGGHTKLCEETIQSPQDLGHHLLAFTPCLVRIHGTGDRARAFYAMACLMPGCTVELVFR